MTGTIRRALRRVRTIACVALAACFTDGGSLGPIPVSLSLDRLALVEVEGNRPRLVILDVATGARTIVHFTGTIDSIPGNDPFVPLPTDDNILAMRPPSWRPDGKAVALSVVVAHDQSEVVVVPLDGLGPPRVASVNTQNILSAIDWSPDGRRLYYAMSTFGPVSRIAVFETDLESRRVTGLTAPGSVGGVQIAVRASASGAMLFVGRVTGEDGAPLFDYRSSVEAIDLATGGRTTIASNIPGRIEAIARAGDRVLAIARVGQMPDTRFEDALVWRSLAGGAATTLATGLMQHALLDDDESLVTFQVEASPMPGDAPYAYRKVAALSDGKPADAPLEGTNARTMYAAAHVGTSVIGTSGHRGA